MSKENVDLSTYERELSNLETTYDLALSVRVKGLVESITATSQSSLIGVGSGGSFTVASLLCSYHEANTGRVSRPSTPLEIVCNPSLASSSPAFFISAEGKNPDIVEALSRARHYSARAIHVITNRAQSPLMHAVGHLRDVRTHVFEIPMKDGYLATNTLLLDSILISRAFGELGAYQDAFPMSFNDLSLGNQTLDAWLADSARFAQECASRGALIVVYAPSLRPIVADLESKLSESALLFVQITDLRSFAHGRHLWLAERPNDCAVLALIDPTLDRLWDHMVGLLPEGFVSHTMRVTSNHAPAMIAGLVAQMRFVGLVAKARQKDPGRPKVPLFARDLHYADISSLVAPAQPLGETGESEKFSVLGAVWPYAVNKSAMRRARQLFQGDIESQVFRAVVFDYDGTLRTTQQDDAPPSQIITEHLCKLTQAGVTVAIVSGRGGSLRDRLREGIPNSEWDRIHLGLYNGGWITTLGSDSQPANRSSEFLNHVSRIVRLLKSIGVPIAAVKPTPPYQVSVRFQEGVDTAAMWFVIGDALRHAGLRLSGMVRSRHSIDVLAPEVSKPQMIAHLIQERRILPQELIAFGDQGAWPGNDAALLEHKFSLSVDLPSRRLDRGWKLAPTEKRGVDAMLWYFERFQFESTGFKVAFQ